MKKKKRRKWNFKKKKETQIVSKRFQKCKNLKI
jgi:hypothetical protein